MIDDLRAGDSQFEANRNAGFTTVLTVGRTGIFNGRSAVIDLLAFAAPRPAALGAPSDEEREFLETLRRILARSAMEDLMAANGLVAR